jgi:epsilon-lactone hydrolase
MSAEMQAIKTVFSIRKRLGLNRFGRKAKPAANPNKSILANTDFSTHFDFGFELNQVSPKKDPDRVIIYLHGGGYVNAIAKQHWQLIEELCVSGNSAVLVPRYGLAPHHDVDDALKFLSQVFEYAKSLDLEIVVAGDSAGGGLALAAIQQLGIADQVARLVLISPWLDSDFEHPELNQVQKHDPWLVPSSLRRIAAVWSGEDNHQNERVSPLRADLKTLPKTMLMIGTWDVLLFDARQFFNKATRAGVDISYTEQPDALHVYPLLPTPEGVKARSEILSFITS